MDSKHSDDDYIINDTEYEEDEADIAFDKQEKSKKKGSVIRRIILIICIIVFCVSAGMLIKILLEYKKGSDIYKDVQSEVLDDKTPVTVEMPEGEVEIPFKYNHEALLAINPDAQGYIYVPSVNLRLPIVQGTDNEKYLETTIDGSINKNGCPFIDYRIKGGITASHVIIYGHTLAELCSLLCINTAIPVFILQKVMTSSTFIHRIRLKSIRFSVCILLTRSATHLHLIFLILHP